MSPCFLELTTYAPSFPRVSGDEPLAARPIGQITWFSPRERG